MAKRYVFAVDIGGTITKTALFNLKYKIIKKRTFATKNYKQKDSLIKEIISQFYRILQSEKIPAKSIKGIGIGVPGLVDRKGIVYELTNIQGWRNVPLSKIIHQKLNIPVFVDNDANLTALGEWRLGRGRGVKNLICITLGTGVGGGIILDGKLFHGSTFTAAEIGHIPLSEKGKRCNCGSVGCLETYVGNGYLINIAQREITKGRGSILRKLSHNDFKKITPRLLTEAAQQGDVLSKEIWNKAGQKIGLGLAGLVNIFNPEMIIIGGGVSFAGKFLLPATKRNLKKHVMKPYQKNLKIVLGQFRQEAGLIGAAILAAEFF